MLTTMLTAILATAFFSSSAHAILPPWYAYQRLLKATVGASPCVTIGEPTQLARVPEIPNRRYSIEVRACTRDAAEALSAVLKLEAAYVVVKVVGPDGTAASSRLSAAPTAKDLRGAFTGALTGNPYLAQVSERTALGTGLTLEFKPEVVQVHNDNISDAYRNTNHAAQDAFKQVLTLEFAGPLHAGLTTAPKAP